LSIWVLIILCGLITFSIRFVALSGLLKFKASNNYLRLIQIIPIVVLTPIIFQAVFFISNNEFSIIDNSKFYAALIAIIISIFSKNVIYTIIIGMGSFWIINEIILIS
tara:strand:+ start:242 stop:565 length:324 start_codon:yes stop_codon:yes gene_type:complete